MGQDILIQALKVLSPAVGAIPLVGGTAQGAVEAALAIANVVEVQLDLDTLNSI
jgi:hypothetical protein